MPDFTVFSQTTVISVVGVTTIKATGNTTALDNALTKNQDCITSLRAKVAANAILAAQIQAAGFTTDKVVAVVLDTNGSYIVYIDDRA